MTTLSILDDLWLAGFSIRSDGVALLVSPSGKLTPEQRSRITAHKAALLRALRPAPANLAFIDDDGSFWVREPDGAICHEDYEGVRFHNFGDTPCKNWRLQLLRRKTAPVTP